MSHISEHINYSNQKIHSHYQMSKIIVNLCSKKCEDNNNSIFQLNHPQNLLLMSIVDTPENYLSNFHRKLYKIKIHTSSINSSSTLFSCSVCAMYNIFHSDLNKHPMVKSYIPGINTSIFPKKNYENTFYEKLVNELHSYIEKQPHVIHSPNASYSLLIKINGTFVKIQKNILPISVQELHNDTILPISKGFFFKNYLWEKIYWRCVT